MVPIAIQNSSQETYPLETFIDNVYEPLTDKVVQDLSEHAAIVDGKLTYTGTASQAPSLLIGPSPVSYTHLDVYKRQVWSYCWIVSNNF